MKKRKPSGRHLVVYGALVGNLLVSVAKFVAAAFTGSSAMLSEGVHSLIDTSNEGLMLYGLHRAEKPATDEHPVGHGREIYFWSFVVALLLMATGAGVALYEGISHILHPEPSENARAAYIVLALSALFEGTSWIIALREFRRTKGDMGYFEAVRASKDASTFTVLFEDSAALLGLGVAALGIFSAQYFELPQLDGVASLGIGAILGTAAILLARETKALLIGESASPEKQEALLRLAGRDPERMRPWRLITLHEAPNQIVVALWVHFAKELRSAEIEQMLDGLERDMRAEHPDVRELFVRPAPLPDAATAHTLPGTTALRRLHAGIRPLADVATARRA